jgi:hypothetical protein
VEEDLAAAEAVSYDLYAAGETLKDAKEDYSSTALVNMATAPPITAVRLWNTPRKSAQYTYDATVQSYELNFRTLFAQWETTSRFWTPPGSLLPASRIAMPPLK